jgi:hypothetical protein
VSLPILDEVNELLADVQRRSKVPLAERALNPAGACTADAFRRSQPVQRRKPRGPGLPVIPLIVAGTINIWRRRVMRTSEPLH